MSQDRPWQLDMFRKGLKKNLRLRALKRQLQNVNARAQCLLITCGDNNGAMNYFLRECGGDWQWADLEEQCIAEMTHLLGDPIHHIDGETLPFADGQFDVVVCIDVHEHLADPQPITREIHRVTSPAGRVIITVPNGDETKLAVRVKHALKMNKEAYGHARVGLTIEELESLMNRCGIATDSIETYSRFFTEMLELSINYFYVKVLGKHDSTGAESGEIAPATQKKLEAVSTSYRIYSIIYPLYWLFSKLDFLLAHTEGYCVLIAGKTAKA